MDYKVGRLEDIIMKVILVLYEVEASKKNILYKNKEILWSERSKFIINKEHLTVSGVEKIKFIKNGRACLLRSSTKNKVY